MNKNSKWYAAGICLIGAVIGIIFVGVLTSVVHWAGTEKFCGTFCHSMDATYAAYKKGLHYKTPSGVTANCSDCHLKYHSNEHIGPIDYVGMLVDKAIAGSSSAWGEIRGTMSTPEKQIAMREELATKVHAQMIDRNFSTCRGCHNIERMLDPKKPLVSLIHQKMDQKGEVVDCLSCHPTAGHNYGYTIPYPPKKEEQANKAQAK